MNKSDSDYARGLRGPGPVPGRGAWANILEIRKCVLTLEKKLKITLLDCEEKDFCLVQLDQVGAYAEQIITRYDRNGPPEGHSDLGDMEATLRLAAKNPDQFKAFDVAGLKAAVAKARGEISAKKK